MREYFCRIKVSALYKYIQVNKLLSTLALRKTLKEKKEKYISKNYNE